MIWSHQGGDILQQVKKQENNDYMLALLNIVQLPITWV